jgi:hypothetical protein
MKFLIVLLSIVATDVYAARFSLSMSQAGDDFEQQVEMGSDAPFGLGGGLRVRGDLAKDTSQIYGVLTTRHKATLMTLDHIALQQSVGFDLGVSEKGHYFIDTKIGFNYLVSEKADLEVGVKYQSATTGQTVASFIAFGGRF